MKGVKHYYRDRWLMTKQGDEGVREGELRAVPTSLPPTAAGSPV